MAANGKYKYFFFSREQILEKNSILSHRDKEYKPGYVVVNGKRKKISQISNDKEIMNRFPDTELVAEGFESDLTYVEPKTIMKLKG